MDYETEEQQLEAIKKWWKENSSMVVTGVAIGVASIFGWQYYQTENAKHNEQASVLYEQVIINSELSANLNRQIASVNQLQAEFTDTPYASLTSLIVAKQQLQAGQTEKASLQYRWVIDNTRQDALKYLAKIRLSRLLLADKKADQALSLLNEIYPDSFKEMVLELKGDVFSTQGNKAQAKAAYIEAMSLSKGSNRWLQLKIDDLGDVAVESTLDKRTEPSA